MILSASGWRKVFAESADDEDKTPHIGDTNRALCALIAETFADYLPAATGKANPVVTVGMDTRPTGREMADAILRVLLHKNITVRYLGVAAAPEIMAYARGQDAFLYISASHNPVGHNGVKFGLNDGGVLSAVENTKLITIFKEKCRAADAEAHARELLDSVDAREVDFLYAVADQWKKEALWVYEDFIRVVVTGTQNTHDQDEVFDAIRKGLETRPISVVCDMNGSARTISIDRTFLPRCGVNFMPFNNEAGRIAHAIIPEPENLTHCADVMQDLHSDGEDTALLGYMPDCDGDRGNIVYWDEANRQAKILRAQEVFALSVVAESAFEIWRRKNAPGTGLLWRAQNHYGKNAVVVNGPTSMRINDICALMGWEVFRTEVGEANVVNMARQKRREGYNVRILGEGSNGGNITWPSCVRDPVATVLAMLKLLVIRDTENADGSVNKGIFHIWCEKSGQEFRYKDDFTLSDIIATLPKYATTGISDPRALLQIRTEDKGQLKAAFQKIFEGEWSEHKDEMEHIYGIHSYEAVLTNGTREIWGSRNWNNGNGGLKVIFFDVHHRPVAFIWMRPSGTEPVFRIMCDIKNSGEAAERTLLRWTTTMIRQADGAASA